MNSLQISKLITALIRSFFICYFIHTLFSVVVVGITTGFRMDNAVTFYGMAIAPNFILAVVMFLISQPIASFCISGLKDVDK
jgi:hypothetical protein